MKKSYTILLFVFACTIVHAQYTKLLDFNNSNGTQPFGAVILSANDSILYGMTNGGGAISNSAGVVFSMNTNGTGYLIMHTFTADAVSGSWPYGSLIRVGNVLYGMTSAYGQHGGGTIFSINTNGSGYTKLYDFNTDSIQGAGVGANPHGTLTISGNVLYGMTSGEGGLSKGNVFSIHTDGTSYTNLLEFNGTNGMQPGYGELTLSGNVLYGTTLYGGANGKGVIFSIHTDGTAYKDLFDFNTANGEMPFNSLTLSGNVLYGTTSVGGAYGKGVIFSLRTDGSGYSKLLDFNGANGLGPDGALMLSGGKLYGTTGGGGANSLGTIFSIDTSGKEFQTLFSFNTPAGTQPRAGLALSGNRLYGTCVVGGVFGDGTVFSLSTHPVAVPICMVTVDDSSKYNHIIWEKPITADIDSFLILREVTTNNYKQIGAVPYSALSEFVDTVRTKYFPFTGDPNAGTYRYKLQLRDKSGNYSALSPYHNTLFVTQTGGTFNWNQYAIEGDSIPVPSLTSYVLYRDDHRTGAWHPVQGVSGTQTSVTDPDYSSFPNGSWRVETTWGISCTPTLKAMSPFNSYNTSKSNVKTSFVNGIMNLLHAEEVNMYPNPSNGKFVIQNSDFKFQDLEIYNVFGERIYLSQLSRQTSAEIDLSSEPKGVYLVKLKTEGGMINKKMVLVK